MSASWLGIAGTTLVIVAYLPQVVHLVTEHCAAGVSCVAFTMWGVGGLALLLYAVSLGDTVFTVLQSYQVVASGLICFYSRRYRDTLCEDHSPA